MYSIYSTLFYSILLSVDVVRTADVAVVPGFSMLVFQCRPNSGYLWSPQNSAIIRKYYLYNHELELISHGNASMVL